MPAKDTTTTLFKMLTNAARLEILDILRNGEQCVCHLEAQLGYRQAYISQQLSLLRNAGLIEDRRDGWNIFYRVVKPQVYTVVDAARALTQESPFTSRNAATCACPKCSPLVEQLTS